MKKASTYALLLILLVCSSLGLSTTVGAQSSVSVLILDPYSQVYGNKGLNSGGYWVGEIPIIIDSDASAPYQTVAYCVNFSLGLGVGTTYPATTAPVADNAEWRAVIYVLSWLYPTTNNAAADQVAIWRLLNQTRGANYNRPSWLSTALDAAGDVVASEAWGKDVVRQDDQLRWVSPVSSNMSATQGNPGETVDFIAQLTTSTGTPRPNVRVDFTATATFDGQSQLLSAAYVTPLEAYTDSQGIAQASVTIPPTSPIGTTVAVQASTHSLWPQQYIDINNPAIQNLIGIGSTFGLTLSTNVCIIGLLQVLPESPIGVLAAFGAVGAGFAVWVKYKTPKKHLQP